MTSLEAAALWVGLNALLLIFLSARVGMNRMKHKVNLGDGDNPEMVKAIRTQGNYIEYAPAAIGGLVLLALLGVSATAIHILGGVFFFARVAHLLGLGLGLWPAGRAVGTVLTVLTLLVTGLWLIYLAAS
ncbi:MAPEG family protein [Hyphococcus luteus]|uniref:Glutathione S-transferase n=1 Tax=Hyphococcus luteus TaxID=2058213 RepID=A0A2S7KAX7_9PROT|nr:MAPEG family protein [Marinicaulis flavus]PQA89618.1 glutathione S-transferase [Marinicaulis flavus]